jgi:hypothetical protein
MHLLIFEILGDFLKRFVLGFRHQESNENEGCQTHGSVEQKYPAQSKCGWKKYNLKDLTS